LLKAAEAIREVVSMAILAEIQDPRVRNVTVTRVEVAPDMRQAKVHVSVRGDETRQRLCLHGLQHAAGFLQAKINERIDARYVPKLHFVLDPGVKNSLEVARILREVLPASPPSDRDELEQGDDEEESDEDTGEWDEDESDDDSPLDPARESPPDA